MTASNMTSWPDLEPMPNKLVNYGVTENGIAIIELISDTDGKPLEEGRTSVNTYTREMWEDIDQAILNARFDGDVSVILLTGHGGKFFSAGATLSTLIIVVASYGLTFFFANFGKYNELYGSIGSLLMILIWINVASYIMLVGFELSARGNFNTKQNSVTLASDLD